MRLWSLHPRYLDRVGLVACWRESLLALKVLKGETKGYRNHPQLERFRSTKDPVRAMKFYLLDIWREAEKRGYDFDFSKIGVNEHGRMAFVFPPEELNVEVTTGQLEYELDHLRQKLILRDCRWLGSISPVEHPEPHPLFKQVSGGVESWERSPASA